jgi:hypothetical protein
MVVEEEFLYNEDGKTFLVWGNVATIHPRRLMTYSSSSKQLGTNQQDEVATCGKRSRHDKKRETQRE